MKVHFDIDGTLEECQAFMALIGFPADTSLSKVDQDAIAVEEGKTADQVHDVNQQLRTLGKP